MLTFRKYSILNLVLFLFLSSTDADEHVVAVSNEFGSNHSNYLIINYNDFGPHSMSFELLGHSWWAWESIGSSDPNERYPIKVVVYTQMTLESVKSKYPVVPEQKQDFRYIKLSQAIKYLDRNIKENIVPSVTTILLNTKQKLENITTQE